MGAVVLDASVIISFLDGKDSLHENAVEIVAAHLAADDRLLIPASVYAEILLGPMRHGNEELIDEFIADARIEIVSIDRSAAWRAARLRVEHRSLRLPDALVLAVARENEARVLTLDRRMNQIVLSLD